MTRRTMDAHRDFLDAPERRRYNGSLYGLFVCLDFESKEHVGADCWRILPGGAVVSMKRNPDGGRVLSIRRGEKPKTADGPRLWDQELATFVEKFRIPGWSRVDDTAAAGIATSFHELSLGPRCSSCRAPIDPSVTGIADVCVDCALKRKRIPDGWEECHANGCTQVIQKDPTFHVNHCQQCAIRSGREYSARRHA